VGCVGLALGFLPGGPILLLRGFMASGLNLYLAFDCVFMVNSFLGAFVKLRKATISFVMSVCPHGITRLPMDGYLWNLVYEDFSKICRETWSLFEVWQKQRVLYLKTVVHLWYKVVQIWLGLFVCKQVTVCPGHIWTTLYLAEFFLKWEAFQKNIVQKMKTVI
jgi:hypothetical protein